MLKKVFYTNKIKAQTKKLSELKRLKIIKRKQC